MLNLHTHPKLFIRMTPRISIVNRHCVVDAKQYQLNDLFSFLVKVFQLNFHLKYKLNLLLTVVQLT